MSHPNTSGDQPDLILKNYEDKRVTFKLHFVQRKREGKDRKTLSRSYVVGPNTKRTFNTVGQLDHPGDVTVTVDEGTPAEGKWVGTWATLYVENKPDTVSINHVTA